MCSIMCARVQIPSGATVSVGVQSANLHNCPSGYLRWGSAVDRNDQEKGLGTGLFRSRTLVSCVSTHPYLDRAKFSRTFS